MAIIVSQIKTDINNANAENAIQKALSALGLYKKEIKTAKLHKTSVDARHGVCFVNSVYIELQNPEKENSFAHYLQHTGEEQLITLSNGYKFNP